MIYRMRAAAPPSATTVFSTPLRLELAPDEEWHWAIVQAKGYPPGTSPILRLRKHFPLSAIARKFGIARSEERQSCCAYARTSIALEGIGVFLSFAACDHSGSSFGAYWENANGLLAVRACCGSYLQ